MLCSLQGMYRSERRRFPSFYLQLFNRTTSSIKYWNVAQEQATQQITPTALKEVSVRLPKSHSEQRAIAEVLSGMDEEIRLLAEERAKVERLKLGAMDDLLTGRVRRNFWGKRQHERRCE